jgi:hypothetical protein
MSKLNQVIQVLKELGLNNKIYTHYSELEIITLVEDCIEQEVTADNWEESLELFRRYAKSWFAFQKEVAEDYDREYGSPYEF